MNRRTSMVIAAVIVLATGQIGVGQQRSQAGIDLQAAIRTETVDGNLTDAVRQYTAIAGKYKGDRPVVAQALLHLAEAHQKLGDKQADEIYQRLVREFDDQRDIVAQARARLANRGTRTDDGTVILRRVWSDPNVDWFKGGISQDGRFLSYAGEYGTTLVIRDLTAGTERIVTRASMTRDTGTTSSAISRDGRQIAYDWCHDETCDLHIAQIADGGTSRTVFSNPQIVSLVPHSWSSDNRIAVSIRLKDHTAQLGWVSATDGSLHVLKTVEWRWPTRMFFSPDGLDIAYDLPGTDTNSRDVFVIATDGSRETPAVASPSDDMLIGWSSDGSQLLFGSDRSGRMDLWSLRYQNRRPAGLPLLVKSDIGDIFPLGITPSGSLYVSSARFDEDIEIATVDLERRRQTAPPARPVQRFIGANSQPTWSPDGRFLAYVTIRGEGRALGSAGGYAASVVSIRAMDTGDTREIEPALSYWRSLTWTPDNEGFIVAGGDRHGRDGIYRISARDGSVTPLVAPMDKDEMPGYEGFSWAPDGKRYYYRARRGPVHERELGSTTDHVIDTKGNLGQVFVSRDGRWIASQRQSGKTSQVVLVPIGGGEPRVLVSVDEPAQFRGMVWAADNKSVLARKALNEQETASELWQIPIDGSAPYKLDVDVNRAFGGGVGRMVLHPDGRRLAMVSGHYPVNEIWVLDRFLTSAKATQ